ncbi:MAG: hypothetical protein CME16_02765, partial [Gemmatimonadetes bacterium]|nr:hypothetical protein [Gemmatimonadota bacterium]
MDNEKDKNNDTPDENIESKELDLNELDAAVGGTGGTARRRDDIDQVDEVTIQRDADIEAGAFRGFQYDIGQAQDVTPMASDGHLAGNLDPESGDANYHSITLEAGQTYTFDTFGSDFDTTLALFDTEGNALTANDDMGSYESQI